MGLKIEGSLTEYSPKTVHTWAEALDCAKTQATKMDIPYALVGSLSFLMLTGKSVCPNDLDIFLMCPEKDRIRYAEEIRPKWNHMFPRLDLSQLFYYGDLTFEQSQARLQYKSIDIPVDPAVFQTLTLSDEHFEAELLNPLTTLELMRRSPSNPKTRKGIQLLSESINDGIIIDLPQPDFSAFELFEQERAKNLVWRLRRKLDLIDEDGDQIIAKIMRYSRNNVPQINSFAKRFMEKMYK